MYVNAILFWSCLITPSVWEREHCWWVHATVQTRAVQLLSGQGCTGHRLPGLCASRPHVPCWVADTLHYSAPPSLHTVMCPSLPDHGSHPSATLCWCSRVIWCPRVLHIQLPLAMLHCAVMPARGGVRNGNWREGEPRDVSSSSRWRPMSRLGAGRVWGRVRLNPLGTTCGPRATSWTTQV